MTGELERSAEQRAGQHREVLQAVGAGIGVVRVVRGHAVVAEIDAECTVRENRVPEDHVAGCQRLNRDAPRAVAGDDVAGAGADGGPADRVGRGRGDENAVRLIRDERGAIARGANEVVLHH